MKLVPEFDGLRGYLSTLVVFGHAYPPLAIWGWGCMDLFFCLSGLLITTQILNGKDRSGFWLNYARRRILRVWPSYYVLLAVMVGGSAALVQLGYRGFSWPPWPGTALQFLFLNHTEFLFTPYPVQATPGYLPQLDHTWSVSLEEQFYLLAPAICALVLLSKRPEVILAGLSICLIAGCTVMRSRGINWGLITARFDGFATGMFIGVLMNVHPHLVLSNKARWVAIVALALSLTVIVLLYLNVPLPPDLKMTKGSALFTYGVAAFAIFAAGLFWTVRSLSGGRLMCLLRWKPALFLGRMSYSTYLWHWPVIWYLSLAMSHSEPITTLQLAMLRIVAAYAVAYAAFVTIERPILRYRSRHTDRDFPVPAAAQPGTSRS